MLKNVILMLSVAGVAYFYLPNQAIAQQQPAEGQSQIRQIGNLNPSRAGISNYDMRMYDRVKDINRRTVRIQRYVIIGFAALFIFIPFVVVFAVRYDPRALSEGDRKDQPTLQSAFRNLLNDIRRVANDTNNKLLPEDKQQVAGLDNNSPSTSKNDARSDP